jgi:uncharacterized protein
VSDLLALARGGLRLAGRGVLDLHGHIGRHLFPMVDTGAAGIVRVMDRVGVDAIVVSHIQCEAFRFREGNAEVLRAMRAHPGRILGYVIVFPSSEAEVTAEMERCVAAGFSGLKIENVNGLSYLHPAYRGALAVADERRMPVLLHTWGGMNDEFREIRELAERYPNASFLLAHAGAGGTEAAYLALARDHRNVHLDLALSAAPRGIVERLVRGAGADRVTYGSDCCFISLAHQIGKVLGARITDEEKLLVLGGNARRILGRVAR